MINSDTETPLEEPVEESTEETAEAPVEGPVDSAAPPGRGRRFFGAGGKRGCGRGCGLAVLITLALALLFALFQWLTWPDVARLADENPESTAFMRDYERRAEARDLPALRHRWVPTTRISANLKHAVLVSEDMSFFDHDGFEVEEVKIALREAWEEKEMPRGASTLTQQLVKNLWLSPSRNPWRKVKEAMLTRQVEEHLSKQRILELYLNVVEFGPGVYGAEAASRAYFGTSAAGLSREQGAALAAGLPRPSHWYPGSGSSTAQRRARRTLRRMSQSSWLRKSL